MTSWRDFRTSQPELAEPGTELLYHFGVGLAFLSTVRADGGPRVHPICPLITTGGLYAFIVPSPKRRDLHRDGRYAMHTFPLEDNEDAFYLTGTARPVADGHLRAALAQQFAAERANFGVPAPGQDQELFEFEVESAMLTLTTSHGDPEPQHTIWRAA
ncbi:MAG: hypothetical protein ACR2FU_20285 [Streptosporangiaceae bacterium]